MSAATVEENKQSGDKQSVMASILTTISRMYQRRKFFFGLIGFGVLAMLYYVFKATTEQNRIDDLIEQTRLIIPQDPDLENIPSELMQRSKCPACLGQSLCEDIDQGIIKIRPQSISDKGFESGSIYYGKFEENEVILKTLAPQKEWDRFDKFLCQNVTQSEQCDVSSVILKSYMAKPELALTIPHLKQSNNIVHDKPDGLPFTLCLTSQILEVVKDVHAIGVNDEKENEKSAELYTSTVVNQEAMLSMYLKVSQADWPLPRMEGNCGRLLIYAHPGKPLRNILNGTWAERADMAVQVLQLVESFVNSDPDLLLAVSDFSFDKFAVNEEGEVIYTDLSDMLIAERLELNEEEVLKEKCNTDCFKRSEEGLLSKNAQEQKSYCSKLPTLAPNVMHALACKTILSDLPEHKKRREHNLPGLLHGLPTKHEKDLKELLLECVEETKAGGRVAAVEKIINTLQEYLDF